MQLELIADYPLEVGEGPGWHPMEKRLYWVDIENGLMFRYDPASGKHERCYEGPRVGGFTVQADGSLLMFGEQGNISIWRDGKVVRTLVDQIPAEHGGRFNDVIADPEGRVFCGTLSDAGGHNGRLYLLERDGSLTKIREAVGVCNGMGFSPDLKTFYFTDTLKYTIFAFDYDRATGGLSGERVFVRASEGDGLPDGMTVDADGDVWSARWDGYLLVRYGPDGKEKQRIKFPTRKVSSCAFAGDDYADLYVTTAGGDDRAENGPTAGSLYRLRPGVKGRAEFYSRVVLGTKSV